MGRRWVDGIGSLTSAGAVNTSTATSRSAKIRANGPMCAAARGKQWERPGTMSQNSFLRAVINVLQRARHIFALTRTQLRARSTRRELGFTAGRWLAFRASRPAGVRSRTSPARGETTAAQRRPRNAAESRGNVVKVSDLVMSNNERVDRAHVRANRAFEGELVFEGEWVPPTPFNGIAFLASGVVLRHLHRRTQARGAPRPSSIAHPKTKMKRGQAVRAPTRPVHDRD